MSITEAIGGPLPPSWRLTTLGALCDESGGEVQTGPFGSQLHAEDYVVDGIPSVMPKDIVGDRISVRTIARVSETDAVRLGQHRLRAGDVVYSRRGDIGRRALVTEGEEGWLCGTGCLRIRLGNADVTPEYLLAYLGHPAVRAWVESKAQGATMLNLNTSILRAVPLRVPPLAEQRRIADILDKADAIRRKRKEAIALTEELLRSAFLDMFGDPVTNPKGWPVKPLAHLGRVITGNTPSRAVPDYFGNDIEWIKSDNINTPSHYLTRATEGLSAQGRAVGRTVPAGSTLMTCIAGSPDCIGNVALADRQVAFNQQINAVTPHNGIDYRFLYVLLVVGKRLIQAASTNSMKGMVSKGKLEDVLVPSPPPSVQGQFGEAFDRVLQLSRRQEIAQRESQVLFDTTVQRAFSGGLAS